MKDNTYRAYASKLLEMNQLLCAESSDFTRDVVLGTVIEIINSVIG